MENGFIINLSNAKSSAEVIYELSSILDLEEARNKKICLKLRDVDLNLSQLLSIKALIESMDSKIGFIDTNSQSVKDAAESLNIEISELKNEVEIPELDLKQELETPAMTVEEKLFAGNEHGSAFVELAQEEGLIVPKEQEKSYIQMEKDEIPETELEGDNESVDKIPTLYVNQNLRSGQTITSAGNIVVIGDAHPGSEIIARGDITVWGVLGGIAQAGSKGNEHAKIRALKLNAIQLRIASHYARRANISNVPFVQKSSSFTPEVALIEDKKIVIKPTYEVKEK